MKTAHSSSSKSDAERLRTTVATLGSRGEGIVETPEGSLYLPFTAPGDEVELCWRPSAKGRMTVRSWQLVKPSSRRREPDCRHFGRCGGCMLQHIDEQSYAGWLRERIVRALNTQGLARFADRITSPAISPPGGRRRLVLHARASGGRSVLGLHARRSHVIIDLAECPVARPSLWATIQSLRLLLDRLVSEGPLTITATETATGIDILLTGHALPDDPGLLAEIAAWAEETDIAALSWSDGGRPQRLIERREPVVAFGGIAVPFPSGAFLQATKEGEKALQGAVREWMPQGARLLDLFAGLGTLSLPLVRHARNIVAAEGNGPAVEALRQAVTAAGIGKKYAVSHCDLFRAPLDPKALAGFDAVIIDPPRAGAKMQTGAIARSAIPQAILISCNPNTWARDARLLVDAGFVIAEIRPVAQFLWSDAVEVASLFIRAGGADR